MPSNWRDLLLEFDDVDPPLDLWQNVVARAQPGMRRRRIPRLPQRAVHALIAAAVIGAAVLGMLFASLLHHDAAPVGPARQPSKVGAQAWLGVLAADVQHRITLSRELVAKRPVLHAPVAVPGDADLHRHDRLQRDRRRA